MSKNKIAKAVIVLVVVAMLMPVFSVVFSLF